METRFVGNARFRLLADIPNPGTKDRKTEVSYTYSMPYPIYFPLEARSIKTVDIEIVDENREIFFEWGITQFLVHVCRKRET